MELEVDENTTERDEDLSEVVHVQHERASSHEVARVAEDDEDESDGVVEVQLAVVFVGVGDSVSDERVQVVSERHEVVVFDFVGEWGVGVVLETLDAVSTPEQSPGREVLVA